jgi:hypothetical protein
MRLNTKAFALTTAILSGAGSFALTLLSVLTGFAREFFELIAPFHPGYSHAISGVFISTFWMFVYGLIVGVLFSSLYNSFLRGKE